MPEWEIGKPEFGDRHPHTKRGTYQRRRMDHLLCPLCEGSVFYGVPNIEIEKKKKRNASLLYDYLLTSSSGSWAWPDRRVSSLSGQSHFGCFSLVMGNKHLWH